MKVSVGVFIVSLAVIASVSGFLEPNYGYQDYTQNQVRFTPQVVTSRPVVNQMVPGGSILSPVQMPFISDHSKNPAKTSTYGYLGLARPEQQTSGSSGVASNSFYDYVGLGKPDQQTVGSSRLTYNSFDGYGGLSKPDLRTLGAARLVTNSHPLLTDVITDLRNLFRWFLPIPGIIFDGVMTLVRLPLTSIVLGTEGTVKIFQTISQGIWNVFSYPARLGLKIVQWFLGPVTIVFLPFSIIGDVISWFVSGLVHVFIVFPIQAMALLSATMVVEAIHALRFIIVTIVNLPLNTLVDFLSSEIAVLNWWG